MKMRAMFSDNRHSTLHDEELKKEQKIGQF